MQSRRVSITDVAQRAGVSKSTVSHVINKTRFVEEDTRSRVLEVIAELGYQPSLAARSLTTNRTEIIGVIVSDVANNFFGDVLRGIEDIFRPVNYSIVVCNTDEIFEREDAYIDLLLRQRVDGVIAAATSKKWDALTKAEHQHTPVVFLDRAFEGLEGPYVGVNNRGGAYLGTRHLIDCGHTRIGILAGFQRLSTMQERLTGFRQALVDSDIPHHPEWEVESLLTPAAGRDAALKILSHPDHPTALFLSNNYLSLGALLALNDLGLTCPDDISLIGFDDHPWAAVTCPPLTVIRQPARKMGEEAARILLNLINGEPIENPQLRLNCELVLRQSCQVNNSR